MILATICYIQRDGHTLMLHRNKKPNDIHAGKWNGLGGKFEAGETPEECIRREVEEEAGLIIRNPRLHGLLMFPKFKGMIGMSLYSPRMNSVVSCLSHRLRAGSNGLTMSN